MRKRHVHEVAILVTTALLPLTAENQVLLDAAVLVAEVHLHLGPGAEDPGREGLSGGATTRGRARTRRGPRGGGRCRCCLDERLEEPSGSARVVEDEGAADLDLAHGELEEVAGFAVGVGERRRDDSGPPGKEVYGVSI